MFLTRQILPPFFEPVYLQLGRDLYERRQVLEVIQEQDGLILARVKDGGRTRRCHIRLNEQHGQLAGVDGDCSCKVGVNCKHVVAALLHYMDQPPKQDDLFGMPSDKWLYQQKAARPERETVAPPTDCLLYLLEVFSGSDGVEPVVSVVRSRRLVNGGYAKPVHFSGSHTSLSHYVSEEDRVALLLLQSISGNARDVEVELVGESGARALEVLIDTGRCHWLDEKGPVLTQADPIDSELEWRVDDNGRQRPVALALDKDKIVLPLAPPRYLDVSSGFCGLLVCGIPDREAALLLAAPPVPLSEIEESRDFIRELSEADLPLPQQLKTRQAESIEPRPVLRLFKESVEDPFADLDDETTVAQALLVFDYNGSRISPLDREQRITRLSDDVYEIIARDSAFEESVIAQLDDIGLIADEYVLSGNYDDREGLLLEPVHLVDTWIDFMLLHRRKLEADGWLIEVDDDFEFHIDEADDWYADIDEAENDWFALELGVTVDGEAVNLLPFLVSYLDNLKGQRALDQIRELPDDFPLLMQRDNGRILHAPLKRVRHIIDTLVELYDPGALDREGRLSLTRYHGRQLLALEQGGQTLKWAGGEALRAFGEKLKDFDGVRVVEPPATLKAELRDYQREGLSWLQFLREYDLGGILADDMGLGKTVQALAHLLVERQQGRADHPSLVVAPTSLMVNWRREAERFAPSLKVLVLQGIDRQRHFAHIGEYDLVLTTYPLLSRDTEVLLGQDWHLAVLDEAQHIKNPKSKAAQTACQLNARHRLCLTGTPMENHLGELWSQMHFLMPGLLGDERRFRKLFRNPIEKHADGERQRQLRERVAAFMLRRNKAEVATELPPKSEIVSEVELDGAQRDLYETIRVSMSDKVRKAIDSKGIERSQIIILDALLKLRQVCCHPRLLKLPSAQKVKQSAKLAQLMEMLPEMIEEGRRILLFSQFTSMLAIIEQELDKRGIDFVKLTGQTRDRATPIDRFQDGEVPLFLISLKAGGSGLNLTAADTVIHYDPWWNPAAENQATDRAHRIGQDKPVFVYKMITSGTVEEKIVAMQQKKKALADALFDEAKRGSALSAKDLQGLFEPL